MNLLDRRKSKTCNGNYFTLISYLTFKTKIIKNYLKQWQNVNSIKIENMFIFCTLIQINTVKIHTGMFQYTRKTYLFVPFRLSWEMRKTLIRINIEKYFQWIFIYVIIEASRDKGDKKVLTYRPLRSGVSYNKFSCIS